MKSKPAISSLKLSDLPPIVFPPGPRAVDVVKIKGLSFRSLGIAFKRLRDSFGMEVIDEPFWGPEDGGAFLRKNEYRIQLSFRHDLNEFEASYYGQISEEELKKIVHVLNEPPLPQKE
jgi:hypothetical protein